jgi:hypothetical protein
MKDEKKTATQKKYFIKKSYSYTPGVDSITAIVGKVDKLKFDKGETIEVNKSQLDRIKALGWSNLTSKPEEN